MYDPSVRKIIKKTTLIISFILCIASSLFAKGPYLDPASSRDYIKLSSAPRKKKGISFFKIGSSRPSSPNIARQGEKEEELSALQKQARMYRAQGVAYQGIGNLDAAMSLYQKAIELDPKYAVVYNDLGVAYEEAGLIDQAEESYLKAIKVDPFFLSPYSNLALVYESKRDLDKAYLYWRKRAELGSSDDPWTEKAKQRLSDIRTLQLGGPSRSREQIVFDLMREVQNQKAIYKKDERQLARAHLQKAKLKYENGDDVGALREAFDAKQLDSSNKEIDEFIDKVQARLLTR